MKILLSCFLLIHGFSGFSIATKNSPVYSRSYTIFIRGAVAGSEIATEEIDEKGNIISSSKHEMLITDGLEDKRMAFATTMVLAKDSLIPLHYNFKYTTANSSDYYDVNTKDGKISRTLSHNGHVSEVSVQLQPNLILLDFNVYHHYDYLVRKYNFKLGGKQTLAGYIPPIGNDIKLVLSFISDEKAKIGSKTINIKNFMVEFVNVQTATFAVDQDNRLVRLVIPKQNLEVVRTDLITKP